MQAAAREPQLRPGVRPRAHPRCLPIFSAHVLPPHPHPLVSPVDVGARGAADGREARGLQRGDGLGAVGYGVRLQARGEQIAAPEETTSWRQQQRYSSTQAEVRLGTVQAGRVPHDSGQAHAAGRHAPARGCRRSRGTLPTRPSAGRSPPPWASRRPGRSTPAASAARKGAVKGSSTGRGAGLQLVEGTSPSRWLQARITPFSARHATAPLRTCRMLRQGQRTPCSKGERRTRWWEQGSIGSSPVGLRPRHAAACSQHAPPARPLLPPTRGSHSRVSWRGRPPAPSSR